MKVVDLWTSNIFSIPQRNWNAFLTLPAWAESPIFRLIRCNIEKWWRNSGTCLSQCILLSSRSITMAKIPNRRINPYDISIGILIYNPITYPIPKITIHEIADIQENDFLFFVFFSTKLSSSALSWLSSFFLKILYLLGRILLNSWERFSKFFFYMYHWFF